ncbi:DNA replication regulator SLD3 [Teratosphaeria destructans]|uniref:DNA replication regulator SLD3 n=1 Tax=Teratosphaeria destructans TaxID=418781 RepID=A0A9W7W676_9PEZI|nr:DNA replication regulator SLD3 [Teratosphaeria destructans]
MSLISDVSLHRGHREEAAAAAAAAAAAETRIKRRRDEDTTGFEIDRRPFAIKPDSSDPFEAPRIFTPVCLLSRTQLPLAYLDTSTGGSRLFTGHIRTLEIADGEGPSILVAEDEKARTLYAIERTQRRTYALCKLGTWVARQQLESAAKQVLSHDEPRLKRRAVQSIENAASWWMKATLEPTDDTSRTDLLKLSMRPDLPKARQASEPDAQIAETDMILAPSTAGEPLQELAKHYLEALYVSRTSLAYFSKGPLSRARAAFSADAGAGRQPSELIGFLRETILSISVMDKKYKDAATEFIKELPVTGLETPEQQSKTRKRRKWKSKRDKTGFFQDEKEYLEKWWRTQDDSHVAPSSAETVDAGLKRRLARLRGRETYLQIIMALEVLALEAVDPPKDDDEQAPDQIVESQMPNNHYPESQPSSTRKKPKCKKRMDLAAILDSLVDRLCIWHSLESHSPAKKLDAGVSVGSEDTNDELRSFCVEVIIPFYVPRVPQHAASANRKLGGPSAATPAKRSTSGRRPGDPATRAVPENKPRKPLSRVASDAFGRSSRQAPSLHRSATDTAALLPHVKREGSETTPAALDNIPPAKIPQPRKRSRLMHSQSFTHLASREVDLNAASRAIESKKRKNASVTQQVQDAISALRKPNRALAVQELAASTDANHAKATARGRSAAASKKRPDTQSKFHVAATPKHPRTAKASGGMGDEARDGQPPVSSVTSYVPASSVKRQNSAGGLSSSLFAVPQTSHRPKHSAAPNIEDTPSRGLARCMPPTMLPGPGTLESPTLARHNAAIQETPSRPVRTLCLKPPASALVPTSPNPVRAELPARTEGVEAMREQEQVKSIYETLGWNDDYEELA